MKQIKAKSLSDMQSLISKMYWPRKTIECTLTSYLRSRIHQLSDILLGNPAKQFFHCPVTCRLAVCQVILLITQPFVWALNLFCTFFQKSMTTSEGYWSRATSRQSTQTRRTSRTTWNTTERFHHSDQSQEPQTAVTGPPQAPLDHFLHFLLPYWPTCHSLLLPHWPKSSLLILPGDMAALEGQNSSVNTQTSLFSPSHRDHHQQKAIDRKNLRGAFFYRQQTHLGAARGLVTLDVSETKTLKYFNHLSGGGGKCGRHGRRRARVEAGPR